MTDPDARTLMQKAWAARRGSFEADPEEKQATLTQAIVDLETAASLCREQGSSVDYAQAVHLRANVELDLGNVDRAWSLWDEAVAVLRGTDDALQLAHKVRHLGDLHRHCGRLDDAESCYAEALSLHREHDSPGSLDFANASSRMADLKEHRGERTEALGLWRETRDLYDAVGLARGVEDAEQRIDRLSP